MTGTYLKGTLVVVVALVVTAQALNYDSHQTAKACPPQIQYVTITQSVPRHVTKTEFLTDTQYVTQVTTQYLTETQVVPEYVTTTQSLDLYVTETVRHYVTATIPQPHYVTVQADCQPQGGYGGRPMPSY
ncbi:uncharacterized protein LOC121860136 [Homarus americanus]|uniref:Uncharacterized protein n=1 Tax=Homarus americanus TaxID=6706 RepID=A0A8J5TV75_HOMAM|nr:uncharacterized protein LOC121860136 [Homarus americanus]KAG7177813.1 hypothetical protein Hamer_G023791 [Homarus americanus]